MKISNIVYFITFCELSQSSLLHPLDIRSEHNLLTRRVYGPIATECNFEPKLKAATTEPGFNQIMNDCNLAHNKLFAQNSSQQNAIALQNEIAYIKEQFSIYKNNYFLTHPSGQPFVTSPTSTTITTNSTTTSTIPTSGPVTPGQTVTQHCDLENSISKVTKVEQFDGIVSSCNKAYSEILTRYPERNAELGAEWQTVVNRIEAVKIEFAKTYPSPPNAAKNELKATNAIIEAKSISPSVSKVIDNSIPAASASKIIDNSIPAASASKIIDNSIPTASASKVIDNSIPAASVKENIVSPNNVVTPIQQNSG